jgi:hypothetical protein
MQHHGRRRSRTGILPPPLVALAVRVAVLAQGARQTASHLGICDTTVSRIAARLPCYRASIELAARRLGIDLDHSAARNSRLIAENVQHEGTTFSVGRPVMHTA